MQKYLTKRNLIIAGVILFIALIIWAIIAAFNKPENLNPGGTGGDYTPSNWVIIQGIDEDFRMSDNSVVLLRNTLQYYLQTNYPKDGDYVVTANKTTLTSQFEPNVYRYTGFEVTVDDKTTLWLHNMTSFVLGTGNTLIADKDNTVTLDGVLYKGLEMLLQQGVVVDSATALQHGIGDNIKPKKTVMIAKEGISTRVNTDGSCNTTFTATIDGQKYTGDIHYFYDTTKSDTATLTNSKGKAYNFTLELEEQLHD